MDEIHRERNAFVRQVRLTAIEYIAVVIAGVAVAISLLALGFAAGANAHAVAQTARIEELSDKIGVLEVRVINAENRGKKNE